MRQVSGTKGRKVEVARTQTVLMSFQPRQALSLPSWFSVDQTCWSFASLTSLKESCSLWVPDSPFLLLMFREFIFIHLSHC